MTSKSFLFVTWSNIFASLSRYWGQMFDELPMVYSSCTFIYSLYMVRNINVHKTGINTINIYFRQEVKRVIMVEKL